MKVYQAINKVQADLAKDGIGKDRNNQQQGYKFRGIDDVYNALAPILARNGLCILPRTMSREMVERQTKSGGVLFYVTVGMEFDFVATEDGSKHTVVTYGEAMDSGDKATNKAMSAAYKYACMQAFSIPTEGNNDADAQTHEVESQDATRLREHLKACEVHKDSITAITEGITMGNLSKAAEAWAELDETTKQQLWVAPTKGGKAFTTKEREIMKSKEFREAGLAFQEPKA